MVGIAGLAVLSLQGGILGLLAIAVRRRDIAASVNALGSLVLALLPALLEVLLPALLGRSVAFGQLLPLWVATAGVLHTVGMLGAYETTWWWDHLAHTVSAGLVAAVIYAAAIVWWSAGTAGPLSLASMTTIGFTVVIGLFWELVELVARTLGERLDIDPVLIQYGWRDTAADLGFDLVAALLVVGVDLRLFVPLVEQFPGLASAVLVASGGVIVGGSALLGLLLVITRSRTA